MIRVAVTLLQCWHRTPGGTAISAIEQARAVAATGEVDLVGVGPWNRSLPPEPWTPPVPVRHLPLPYQAVYDGWHRIGLPPVQLVTGKVDLVHATTVTVPPRWRGTPVVVTVHDTFPLTDPDRFTKRGARLMGRGLELARHADLVIVASEFTAAACRDAGFDDDRMVVVPWGVAAVTPGPDAIAAARRRHRLDRPFLLWVGTVEPRKNLEVLLSAVARLEHRDVDLVIAGPDGWQVDLDALVAPVRDRVRTVGFLPPAELSALYAAAELLCLPSHAEGFGLTALEAMVQGTPVIGSDTSSIPEVVGDTGILVDPTDVEAWSGAIDALVGDDTRRAELGARAAERAAGFTWERCARSTVDAYRRVLGG